MGDNDTPLDLAIIMQVLIAAFDDVPEHTFEVLTVEGFRHRCGPNRPIGRGIQRA